MREPEVYRQRRSAPLSHYAYRGHGGLVAGSLQARGHRRLIAAQPLAALARRRLAPRASGGLDPAGRDPDCRPSVEMRACGEERGTRSLAWGDLPCRGGGGPWSQIRVPRVNCYVKPRYRDDRELLAAARSEPQAFAVFYDRYEAVVASYLARRVRDPEAVADLTAEVFAAVLNAAPRYRAKDATATGWLLTIAHNKLAKSLRRGRVEASAQTPRHPRAGQLSRRRTRESGDRSG
jgi:hypothetical protein